jgi:hypothetical protein
MNLECKCDQFLSNAALMIALGSSYNKGTQYWVFLEQLILLQLPVSVKPLGSSPYSQKPAIGPYPTFIFTAYFSKIHFSVFHAWVSQLVFFL